MPPPHHPRLALAKLPRAALLTIGLAAILNVAPYSRAHPPGISWLMRPCTSSPARWQFGCCPRSLAGADTGGFPDHPHRGIATVTFLLDGELHHADNRVNSGKFGGPTPAALALAD
jgi:hypothetical protein